MCLLDVEDDLVLVDEDFVAVAELDIPIMREKGRKIMEKVL